MNQSLEVSSQHHSQLARKLRRSHTSKRTRLSPESLGASTFSPIQWALDLYDDIVYQARFWPWEIITLPNDEFFRGGPLCPTSLLFLSITNPIRKPMIRLVRWKMLEWIMLCIILANCVTLCMDSNRPGYEETELYARLRVFNFLFIAAFTIEMVIKVIALGFVMGKHTYLRNGWNILDFTVVIFGWLELIPGFGNYTIIRVARILRPLRLVTKIEALRILVECMLRSLPMLGNVAILAVFFYAIFGIASVELFKGRLFNRCGAPDPSSFTPASLVNGVYQSVTYTVSDTVYADYTWPCSGPMASSVTWRDVNGTPTPSVLTFGGPSSPSTLGRVCPSVPSSNPNDPNTPLGLFCVPFANPTPYGNYRHWDNILTAWLAIFQHTAPQDWSFIMYGDWDGFSWWTWPYSILMVIIGAFLIQNLTLAILFLNFTKNYAEENKKVRDRAESVSMLSRRGSLASRLSSIRSFVDVLEDEDLSQKDHQGPSQPHGSKNIRERIWAVTQSLLSHLHEPWESFRDILYDLQETKAFNIIATVMIILNAIVLALVWYPNYPDKVNVTVVNLNYAFTMFFLFEMLVKVGGLGPQRYCSDNYNIFDAAVTILGVIEMGLALSGAQGNGLSALRALRLLKLFRLAKSWKSLNRMIKVMLTSIKSVAWLTLLLILFIFMTGLLGMILFGYHLESCTIVPGSTQLCPPGLTWKDCPAHFDCYIPCDSSQVYQWLNVPGSPYGGQAYCEAFPRRDPSTISPSLPPIVQNSSISPPPQPPPGPPAPPFSVTDYTYSVEALMLDDATQFWAQVGKPTTPLFSQTPSYDYFYQAFLAVFVLLTQDSWAENNHMMMQLTKPWAALYCVIILVIGTFMLLNLFLAVLIANLDESTGMVKSNITVYNPSEVVPFRNEGSPVVGYPGASTSSRLGIINNADQEISTHPDSPKSPSLPISYMSFWIPDNAQSKMGLSAYGGVLGSNDDTKSEPSPASSAGKGSIVKTSPQEPPDSRGGSKSQSTPPPPSPYLGLDEEVCFGNKIVPLPPALMVSLDPLSDNQGASVSHHGVGSHGHSLRSGSRLHLLGSNQNSRDQNLTSSSTLGLPRSMFMPLPTIEESSGYIAVADKTYFGSGMLQVNKLTGSIKKSAEPRPSLGFRDWLKYAWNRDASLMIFSRSNPIRSYLYRMIHKMSFEYMMLGIVLLSCIELCFDDAMVVPGSKIAQAIYVLDIVFAVAFCIEAMIKIIALGLFWCGPESYLRSGWNWLDLIIALVSISIVILTATSSTNIVWLRSLRSLRALRPLRIAKKMDGINVVVIAIGKAFPAVGEVTIIGSLFYYIFAVLAVNLMAGNFDYCADPGNVEIPGLDPAYLVSQGNIDQSWCESNSGLQLINTSYYHSAINVTVPQWTQETNWGANGNLVRFDNVVMALWVLFQIGSLENWNNIMYFAMWSPQNGVWQNIEGQNTYLSIFFLFFIVFGVFLILNMVIGVSINTFNKMKEENGRMAFLTKGQQEWLMLQRIMIITQPKKKYTRPLNSIRSFCYSLCMNEAFDYFMISVILLNTVFMFLSHQGMSSGLARLLTTSNIVFTSIFVAETILKWMAIGMKQYFKDSWNRFDFFVVVVSVLGVCLDFATTSSVTIFPLLRVLRVVRIIKLMPKLRGLKMMLITVWWSLPALGNVAAVLFVVLFIYSIIGMNIFGRVKPQQFLDEHANFQTFPRAILMLLRFSTGENWNSVMYDCMVKEQCILITQTFNTSSNTTVYQGSYYDSIKDAAVLSQVPHDMMLNQCTPNAAITAIYFCTYMMLVIFLLLQLVIGILIENIDNLAKMEEMQVSQKHIQAFIEIWEELDTHGTGFIDASDMTSLLMRVEWPMGVMGIKNPHLRISDIVQRLVIPLRNKKIHFLETMHALAGRVAGAEVPETEEIELHGQMITRLPRDEVTPKYTLADYYAAVYVRTSIRGFLTRAQLKVLFDELEREMGEEEMLADMEEVQRLDIARGVFPTIVEESSRLSTASNDASAPGHAARPPVPYSRFQTISHQSADNQGRSFQGEGVRSSDTPSPLEHEHSSRRTFNDRLSKSRLEIFRQVTSRRNNGAMADVQSLIKQHQDLKNTHTSLTITPLVSDTTPVSSVAPARHPWPPGLLEGQSSRFDEAEDHPSSAIRAPPMLASVMENEESESQLQQKSIDDQPEPAAAGGATVVPIISPVEADRTLSDVLDLLSTPRPKGEDPIL